MTDTERIADVIVAAVRAATAPMLARCAALETKVAELEARPIAKDAGIWMHGKSYEPGNIVSHGGSAWLCNAAHYSTGSEPSHEHFRLFVKAGRDGRGSR